MEGDSIIREELEELEISIHSLRMEGDGFALTADVIAVTFQSTPSVWRETGYATEVQPPEPNFNPLPPYGGRPHCTAGNRPCKSISIHSLRMEGDGTEGRDNMRNNISIHSLRMEGDRVSGLRRICGKHFNPLPPYGGRLDPATFPEITADISIHSLRMEGDLTGWDATLETLNFNPLPPYGGRLGRCLGCFETYHFNPLPPYGGRQMRLVTKISVTHFNPLPPYGGRRRQNIISTTPKGISIHSLRMEGDYNLPSL